MASKALIDKYSPEELQCFINESSSMKEFGEKIGYKAHTGALSKVLKNRMLEYNLIFTSWQPKTTPIKRTRENVFCKNSTAAQKTTRTWYQKEKDIEYECQICGQKPYWNGQVLTLTLDHIDGDNKNNELTNLRWVCPNCDRQLDTFAGKNIKKSLQEYSCHNCGTEISKGSRGLCVKCAQVQQRVTDRPTREELKNLIRYNTFVAIGKQFNVSDNTIRKWCIAENLPSKASIIKNISQEEWEII